MCSTFPVPIETFLAMVEQRPKLWDKSLAYKSKLDTRSGWQEILEILYPDSIDWDTKKRQKYVFDIIKKWTYVRDSYIRSEKKIARQKMLGRRTKITKPYLYQKHLSFLNKNIQIDDVDESSDGDSSHLSIESVDQGMQIKIEDVREVIEIDEPQSQPTVITVPQSTSDVPPTDSNVIQLMAFPTQAGVINRHVSFFNGLIPTLDKFDDDQVVEFQLGVLQLMKRVKNQAI